MSSINNMSVAYFWKITLHRYKIKGMSGGNGILQLHLKVEIYFCSTSPEA